MLAASHLMARLALAATWVPTQASAQPSVLCFDYSAWWTAGHCFQVFIDDGTKTKVLFVDKLGTELLAAIDANVLPESIGGTRPTTERLVTGADGVRPLLLMCPGTLVPLVCQPLVITKRVLSGGQVHLLTCLVRADALGYVPESWKEMNAAITAEQSRQNGDNKEGSAPVNQVHIPVRA